MQVQATRLHAASAAEMRALTAPPQDSEPPLWVDAVGATVGGTTLGVAGGYAGMELGLRLLESRLTGPPLVDLVSILALAPYYGVAGTLVGCSLGAAVGVGVGVWAARALAGPTEKPAP